MCLITSLPQTLSLAAFSSPLWETLTHSLYGSLSNSGTRWQETGLLETGKGKRQICVSVVFPSGDASHVFLLTGRNTQRTRAENMFPLPRPSRTSVSFRLALTLFLAATPSSSSSDAASVVLRTVCSWLTELWMQQRPYATGLLNQIVPINRIPPFLNPYTVT